MADTAATAAQQELIQSLAQEDIPIKLRCAICNKLAVNAFRLPCCDQSICENCQSTLPSSCPVCEHSPVSGEDCKPNKALRTTIKVFLRTAEKKRETARAAAAPPKPGPPVEVLVDHPASRPAEAADIEPQSNGATAKETAEKSNPQPAELTVPNDNALGAAEEDIPHPSVESVDKGQELDESKQVKADATAGAPEVTEQQKGTDGVGGDVSAVGTANLNGQFMGPNGQWINPSNLGQQEMFNNMGSGLNGADGGYGAMGWNNQAAFDPMMQNGFANGGWGAFPNMMGMQGMSMDPMSQGMYGGFGGPTMGMNGMNMAGGMGFNAAGQGGYDGWSGPQGGWNGAGQQDNFNPNAYGGSASGLGDYGLSSGLHPQHSASGGFNHMSQHHGFQQQYQNQQFQGGRGFHAQGYAARGGPFRGRGAAAAFRGGRGGFGHGQPGENRAFHQQAPGQSASEIASPTQDSATKGGDVALGGGDAKAHTAGTAVDSGVGTKTGNDDESAARGETDPASTNDNSALDPSEAPGTTEGEHMAGSTANGAQDCGSAKVHAPGSHLDASVSKNKTVPLPTGPAALGYNAYDPGARGRGAFLPRGPSRGNVLGFRGRGGAGVYINGNLPAHHTAAQGSGLSPISPVEASGFGVVGAPKAPRALRDGLPNTGIRGRGLAILGRGGIRANGGHLALTQASANAQGRSPSPEQAPSRSRSHSSSRQRSHHSRRHRHRSRSYSETEDTDREHRREHRSRRSHHHRDDAEDHDATEDTPTTTQKPSRDASPGRSPSPEASTRRTHRSRHEESRDKYGRSSHRSHRDRSRDRDRNRERSHRKHRSRSPHEDDDADDADDPSASGPRDARDRKSSHRHRDRDREGKSSRRDRSRSEGRRHSQRAEGSSKQSRAAAAGTDEVNSHDRERAERNRERLLREQQRIAELNGEGIRKDRGGKRESEDALGEASSKRRRHRSGGEAGIEVKGRGSRKHSYKYDDEEGDEERAERVEREREAGRWG